MALLSEMRLDGRRRIDRAKLLLLQALLLDEREI